MRLQDNMHVLAKEMLNISQKLKDQDEEALSLFLNEVRVAFVPSVHLLSKSSDRHVESTLF